jgi:hypothetical protein
VKSYVDINTARKMEQLPFTTPAAYRSASSSTKRSTHREIWNELARRLNTASTELGWQALFCSFTALRPVPGAPIDEFFTKLINIQNQLFGTEESITNTSFKGHVLQVL